MILPVAGVQVVDADAVRRRGIMDELTATDVDPYVVDRVRAGCAEENEIPLFQARLAHGFSGCLLIPCTPPELNALLPIHILRERGAIEDQLRCIASAEVISNLAHQAFGVADDAVRGSRRSGTA